MSAVNNPRPIPRQDSKGAPSLLRTMAFKESRADSDDDDERERERDGETGGESQRRMDGFVPYRENSVGSAAGSSLRSVSNNDVGISTSLGRFQFFDRSPSCSMPPLPPALSALPTSYNAPSSEGDSSSGGTKKERLGRWRGGPLRTSSNVKDELTKVSSSSSTPKTTWRLSDILPVAIGWNRTKVQPSTGVQALDGGATGAIGQSGESGRQEPEPPPSPALLREFSRRIEKVEFEIFDGPKIEFDPSDLPPIKFFDRGEQTAGESGRSLAPTREKTVAEAKGDRVKSSKSKAGKQPGKSKSKEKVFKYPVINGAAELAGSPTSPDGSRESSPFRSAEGDRTFEYSAPSSYLFEVPNPNLSPKRKDRSNRSNRSPNRTDDRSNGSVDGVVDDSSISNGDKEKRFSFGSGSVATGFRPSPFSPESPQIDVFLRPASTGSSSLSSSPSPPAPFPAPPSHSAALSSAPSSSSQQAHHSLSSPGSRSSPSGASPSHPSKPILPPVAFGPIVEAIPDDIASKSLMEGKVSNLLVTSSPPPSLLVVPKLIAARDFGPNRDSVPSRGSPLGSDSRAASVNYPNISEMAEMRQQPEPPRVQSAQSVPFSGYYPSPSVLSSSLNSESPPNHPPLNFGQTYPYPPPSDASFPRDFRVAGDSSLQVPYDYRSNVGSPRVSGHEGPGNYDNRTNAVQSVQRSAGSPRDASREGITAFPYHEGQRNSNSGESTALGMQEMEGQKYVLPARAGSDRSEARGALPTFLSTNQAGGDYAWGRESVRQPYFHSPYYDPRNGAPPGYAPPYRTVSGGFYEGEGAAGGGNMHRTPTHAGGGGYYAPPPGAPAGPHRASGPPSGSNFLPPPPSSHFGHPHTGYQPSHPQSYEPAKPGYDYYLAGSNQLRPLHYPHPPPPGTMFFSPSHQVHHLNGSAPYNSGTGGTSGAPPSASAEYFEQWERGVQGRPPNYPGLYGPPAPSHQTLWGRDALPAPNATDTPRHHARRRSQADLLGPSSGRPYDLAPRPASTVVSPAAKRMGGTDDITEIKFTMSNLVGRRSQEVGTGEEESARDQPVRNDSVNEPVRNIQTETSLGESSGSNLRPEPSAAVPPSPASSLLPVPTSLPTSSSFLSPNAPSSLSSSLPSASNTSAAGHGDRGVDEETGGGEERGEEKRVGKEEKGGEEKEGEREAVSGVGKDKSVGVSWKKSKDVFAEGAFGKVYRGQGANGEIVAVKEVRKEASMGARAEECLRQLKHEIQLLSRLKHPNIVAFRGYGEDEGHFYILLEYVDSSIRKRLDDFGAFREAMIRNYTKQILKGLQILHSMNIIHRDIKGSNILVDGNGNVKLADFGLAKQMLENAEMTSVRGTAWWMAPEVINNDGKGYDFSADVWSLGCTVIEMATASVPWFVKGKNAPPWGSKDPMAAIFQIGRAKGPPPLPENLSEKAQNFLKKCLQIDPKLRPTVKDLLSDPFIADEEEI